MVIVFLICWSPYASLALATILGYAQVHLISKMHALYTVFCVLRARQRTHMKMLMGWGPYMVNYERGFTVQTLKVHLALFILVKNKLILSRNQALSTILVPTQHSAVTKFSTQWDIGSENIIR
jgi:hypothetical protein